MTVQMSEAASNTLRSWESRFDERIARLETDLIAVRRHLHAHPEASGEETETSKFVSERLTAAGLQPRICQKGVGVVADLTLGNPRPEAPLIAIRCELDAVRVPERKNVEYASKNPGVSHACGHDAHTAILLGVALAGTGMHREIGPAETFGARLRFLFQPAEETSQGARWLVVQGVMHGVDSILALHVDPARPLGQIGVREGTLTAHCDEVEIVVEGHGGHAARPHHTVDPVAASAHLVNTLYQFLPRSIDSRSPSVLTIGKISGGYAPNVIPERVELRGSLRTTELPARERLKRRIEEICAGAEQGSGAKIHVRFHIPLAAVYNDPKIMAAMEEASCRVVGAENVVRLNQPSMGGEDFSVYLNYAPGALLRLGCAVSVDDPPFLHSPLFDLDERAIAVGARILFRAALLLSLAPQMESREV